MAPNWARDEGRSADTAAAPTANDDERLGARFGEITIRVVDVFDTSLADEDRALFRVANRLHVRTHESVIRSQLLFKEGDPFSPRLLEESERLLRANRYINDARIRAVDAHDGQVDVEVWTQDVWTLTLVGGFSRSGGVDERRIEFEDTNLFGTGKDLTLQWTSDVDRDSALVRYRDPQLAGTRFNLLARYADRSDGSEQRLDLVRPFYSLEARWSAGVRTLAEDRVDHLYDRGQVTDEFRHSIDRLEAFGGRSRGLENGHSLRVLYGFTLERHRFEPSAGREFDVLPSDRSLAYPWVAVEWIGDRFVETQDLDQIARTEDLQLSTRFQARFGWSSPAFGGDHRRLILSSSVHRGYRTGTNHMLFLSAFGNGRHGPNGFENALLGGRARFYLRNWGRHQFVGRVGFDVAHALDPEQQLLLGGDNGLRGYPLRYQSGDRRFLLTLEQRFYRQREMWHLLHVGAAVFVDAGRAWFDTPEEGLPSKLLSDVGVGLRLSPSRSGRGTMIHFDLAVPLQRDPTIDGLQWLITAKDSF